MTTEDAAPAVDERPAAAVRRRRRPRRLAFGGLVVGLIGLWLSFVPTLLPRGPVFQGVVSGGCAAIGYGLGTALSALTRWLVQREPPRAVKAFAWRSLPVLAVV